MDSLEVHTAQWLLENPLEQPGWVVEDLVPCGLTLLAGDPKIGKSWLALDLALRVSLGESFWGFATAKGGVLYLCLVDMFNRVQTRLQRLVDEANDNLCCAVAANRIGAGLTEQLRGFAREHASLRMVIVDTFQTVRTPSNQTIYSADYDDMGALKSLADELRIALLVLHHTRKMGDGDVFNTISGSNGLMGCADETMVLKRKSRGSSNALLSITGATSKSKSSRCGSLTADGSSSRGRATKNLKLAPFPSQCTRLSVSSLMSQSTHGREPHRSSLLQSVTRV